MSLGGRLSGSLAGSVGASLAGGSGDAALRPYAALWYRAGDEVDDGSGRVLTGLDLTGAGLDLTQPVTSYRPEISTAGLPSWLFSSTPERLVQAALPADLLPSGSFVDWWVAVREDNSVSPGHDQYALSVTDGANYNYGFTTMIQYPAGVRTIRVHAKTSAGQVYASAPVPPSSSARLVHARLTAAGLAIDVDNGAITANTATANAGLAETMVKVDVGNPHGTSQPLDGDALEVFAARNLSPGEAVVITEKLAARYNI